MHSERNDADLKEIAQSLKQAEVDRQRPDAERDRMSKHYGEECEQLLAQKSSGKRIRKRSDRKQAVAKQGRVGIVMGLMLLGLLGLGATVASRKVHERSEDLTLENSPS